MPFRNAVLACFFLAQLVAAVGLVFATTGTPSIEIDEDKLAEAERAHQQRERQRSAPAPSQPDTTPTPAANEPDPEPEPEPDPEPRRERERSQPEVATSRDSDDGADDEVEIDDVREPFDSGQFMAALELAEAYLENDPDQAYIRRVAVTSACATGEIETALDYYEEMNDRDQRTSEHRCGRYNIDLEDEL